MGWSDLAGSEIVVTNAIAESRRFGLPIRNVHIGRHCGEAQYESLVEILDHSNTLDILRYDSSLTWVPGILTLASSRVIVADPTVYWHTNLSQIMPQSVSPPLQFVEIPGADAEQVSQVCRKVFSGYRSHWHFNPSTKWIPIEEAYVEWIITISNKFGTEIVMMTINNQEIGMALTTSDSKQCEILLAGITPDFQSRGYYGQLLHYLEDKARRRGVTSMIISTQASNLNVQTAWQRRDWRPLMTVQTLHLIQENPDDRDH